MRAACKEVGSISDIIFEMRFNPNVLSSGKYIIPKPSFHLLTHQLGKQTLKYVFCVSAGVQFPDSESAAVALQERLLREAAAFLANDQITALVSVMLISCFVPFYVLVIYIGATVFHYNYA